MQEGALLQQNLIERDIFLKKRILFAKVLEQE